MPGGPRGRGTRQLPPSTRTLTTLMRFPFFSSFFFFWYKMIQTTIQNSCAVDGYKRSRDAASARRAPAPLPTTSTVMRAATRLSISKRNMQKKTRMGKGEEGTAEHVPIVQRRVRRPRRPARPASSWPRPQPLCVRQTLLFLWCYSFDADEHRGSSRGFCLGERRVVTSRCRASASAHAGETEASRGLRLAAPLTLVARGPALRMCWRTRGGDNSLGQDSGSRGPDTHSPGPGVPPTQAGASDTAPDSTGLSCLGRRSLKQRWPAPSGPPQPGPRRRHVLSTRRVRDV